MTRLQFTRRELEYILFLIHDDAQTMDSSARKEPFPEFSRKAMAMANRRVACFSDIGTNESSAIGQKILNVLTELKNQ